MDSPFDTAFDSAHRDFLARHPEYADTTRLDVLRATEYERLDRLGHVYLDYTGAGLYAASQIRLHQDLLANGVFGNPHSENPTSLEASRLVADARAAVLRYFNADPADYDVVFTANASGALKLVGESFPFTAGSRYLLSYDNHNSVNGVREFARHAGAHVTYVPVTAPHLRLDVQAVLAELDRVPPGAAHLFAYPAQSNFSGVQHPLSWVAAARERGWTVILDCAAFAPTNRLDLSEVQPDFIPLSFYKMFGYPTGIGALICRHEALRLLRRPWFAGGTITVASVQGDGWYHLAPGHSGFEDGTVDFLGLPAITIGLDHLSSVGVELVHERVMALTAWLMGQLTAATHTNGRPLARVFGPSDLSSRGGTIAFYLVAPNGMPYDVREVERQAAARNISVRTGCFCNPGDGEIAHEIAREDMAQCFEGVAAPVTFEDCARVLRTTSGKTPNTMRLSLGVASNFADCYAFMAFVRSYRDVPDESGQV
jgi:molybdenum cofactor sulfurtransferase